MHILFGTKNQAKIDQIRGALLPLGIEVQGLPRDREFEDVPEDGETVQENARIKARAYAQALGEPVLSMDNGLYFDGLAPEDQPGTHVRRIPGGSDRPTDAEMTGYYQSVIARLGRRINGHWEYALCVASPDGTLRETTIISPRIFVDQPSLAATPGYPLESLQIDPESQRYIAELSREEQDRYWQRTIGDPLSEFIKSVLEGREAEPREPRERGGYKWG